MDPKSSRRRAPGSRGQRPDLVIGITSPGLCAGRCSVSMPHAATARGMAAAAVRIPTLALALAAIAMGGCARGSALEPLREELRGVESIVWDARRHATRAGVSADAAQSLARRARGDADLAGSRSAGSAAELQELELAPEALRADRVVVRKADRVLELHRRDRVLRRFRIALGFEPVGHKQRRGDGRTPEGVYVVDARRETERYGLGLHISYPRPEDVRKAQERGESAGGGIFIHGLPDGMSAIGEDHAKFDWTHGCIAVTDSELAEIAARVVDGTPIEILP